MTPLVVLPLRKAVGVPPLHTSRLRVVSSERLQNIGEPMQVLTWKGDLLIGWKTTLVPMLHLAFATPTRLQELSKPLLIRPLVQRERSPQRILRKLTARLSYISPLTELSTPKLQSLTQLRRHRLKRQDRVLVQDKQLPEARSSRLPRHPLSPLPQLLKPVLMVSYLLIFLVPPVVANPPREVPAREPVVPRTRLKLASPRQPNVRPSVSEPSTPAD